MERPQEVDADALDIGHEVACRFVRDRDHLDL
jgi:hypothetical protein